MWRLYPCGKRRWAPVADGSVGQVELQHGGGAADFVAHHQQRFAVGRLGGGDERQAFWAEVANGCQAPGGGFGFGVGQPLIAGG